MMCIDTIGLGFEQDAKMSSATHLFLTGERGIGKTTLITKIVHAIVRRGAVSAGEATGFRTVWIAGGVDANGAADALYILPYAVGNPDEASTGAPGRSAIPASARPVAERGDRTFAVHPEVFDEDGVAILQAVAGDRRPAPSATTKLIVMDELGFIETNAPAFKDAVMRVLDGNIPVLGVLRKDTNPFLDAVKNHAKVKVVEVTGANRDTLSGQLTFDFFHD